LISCGQKKKQVTVKIEGPVFGTTYHITYGHKAATDYQKSIDSLFYLVNRSLSTYIATSDISKINNGDATVVVDAFFKEVYQKSKQVFEETNGYFDPTVGNLVNAWGFGPKSAKKENDSIEIATMMEAVGFGKTQLIHNKIIKENANSVFDFNSIAKGFAVDVVGRFLELKNVKNYLVEIGGEIRVRGKNDKNNLWKVAIEKPNTDGSQSIQTTIELSDVSMATSGNYRKFRITPEGKKYVHTINPKTGFAIESNLVSASVITKGDCANADAYATAFMAMGLEKTKLFLSKFPHLKVILMYINDEGNLQEYTADTQFQ
jgi:thiamine biosynthesis lipoprotein